MAFKRREAEKGGGFKYKKRDPSAAKRRAEQSGGLFDRMLKEGIDQFGAKEGDRKIRICPPTWPGAEHYGMDVFTHREIGADNSMYICPAKMERGPCPICEEGERAQREGETDYAKKLRPTKRVAFFLIDRDNEKDGPLVWLAPWTVDRDISALSINKRTGEVLALDDPDEGYDVSFERKGKGLNTEYIAMQIEREPSPLSDDPDLAAKWLDYLANHPLPDLLNIFDYDYLKKKFEGGIQSKAAPADSEATPPATRHAKESSDEERSRPEKKVKSSKYDEPGTKPKKFKKRVEIDDEPGTKPKKFKKKV